MPPLLGKGNLHPPNKQVQLLENKVNNLRWRNDELNKEVFTAIQRGHRLAAKLGFQDMEEAELALATQAQGEQSAARSQQQESQLEQLSQRPSDELASHVQALQSELVNHIHLSRATLNVLEDAMTELTALREENERLKDQVEEGKRTDRDERRRHRKKRKEEDVREQLDLTMKESIYTREELRSLKKKYRNLRKAKERIEEKYRADEKEWRTFTIYYLEKEKERHEQEKLNLRGTSEIQEDPLEGGSATVASLSNVGGPTLCDSDDTLITLPSSSQPIPENVTGEQSRSPSPIDECPGSSQTVPDSQPVTFLYPSQQDIMESPTSPFKAPGESSRSPSPIPASSDTEIESQDPTFFFDSQIVPATPAQLASMTPNIRPAARRDQEQFMTPMSVVRPQQGDEKGKAFSTDMGPPSSPLHTHTDPSHRKPLGNHKVHLPDTPVSLPPKKGKGKERAAENDENAPIDSSSPTAQPSKKKYPSDYSIYKGRGRYGAEVNAGKDNINALFEIDPARNEGLNFQYDEVVRDKQLRKQMHASDCLCCHDYYEGIGRLPDLPQPPLWRSPQSSPSKKRKRDSLEDEEDGDVDVAVSEHKNAISRHRHHWIRGQTPPKYWNIGFPDTQEVAEMNAEAARMHARKRAMVADEAERGGKYKQR